MDIMVGKNYKISPYRYPDGKCWQVAKRVLKHTKKNYRDEWSADCNYFCKLEDAFEFIIREDSRNSEGDSVIDETTLNEFVELVKSMYDEYSKSLAEQAAAMIEG